MSASTSPTPPTPSPPNAPKMPQPRRSRPLFLHTTALSDAEYTLYVDALRNILGIRNTESGGCGGDGAHNADVTDEVLELQLVKVHEIHEWMSRRYEDVSIDNIDKVRRNLWAAFEPSESTYESNADYLVLAVSGLCMLRRISTDRSCTSSGRRPRASVTVSQVVNSSLPSDCSCTCATGQSRTNL